MGIKLLDLSPRDIKKLPHDHVLEIVRLVVASWLSLLSSLPLSHDKPNRDR